jgi:hypothetical protein
MTTVNTKSTLDVLPDPMALVQLPKMAAAAFKAAQRFRDDKSGSTMMVFGLTLFPVFFFVGMSVDFSRMIEARAQALAAVDGAALAGARSFQTGAAYASVAPSSNSPVSCAPASGSLNENAQRAACNYLQITLNKNVIRTLVEFPATSSITEFSVRTTSWVRTPFLAAGGGAASKTADPTAPVGCTSHGWQCQKVVANSMVVATDGGGNNGGTNIEVAVMIDTTGSMAESDGAGSTKIATVKKAAIDMVDIMVWDNQTQVTSKIAVIPFSEAIKLPNTTINGDTLINQVRGIYPAGTDTVPGKQNFTFSGRKENGDKATVTHKLDGQCVSERTGPDAYTDAAPSTAKVGPVYVNNDYPCPTTAEVMPLTNDKVALKARINSLTPSGGTAGQMGTAWAWYMLAPNFNYLWPTASAARPYSDISAVGTTGYPVLKKFAVLMTDGDYNTQHCKGVDTWYFQGVTPACNAENGSSQDQAAELCKQMKAKGIEVFTIGSQVSAAAKTFLQKCSGTKTSSASDTSHYYDATDGVKLQQAFRDIALKISSLRVKR